jgi:hypothetical protein
MRIDPCAPTVGIGTYRQGMASAASAACLNNPPYNKNTALPQATLGVNNERFGDYRWWTAGRDSNGILT